MTEQNIAGRWSPSLRRARPSSRCPDTAPHATSRRRAAAILFGLFLVVSSCTSTAGSPGPTSAPGSDDGPDEQTLTTGDDHTVAEIRSIEDFESLARSNQTGQQVVKFSIADFGGAQTVSWMDGNFYELHDEWYFFRLLNGLEVPGSGADPITGQSFASIDDIYRWAEEIPNVDLPLDLDWTDSSVLGRRRLYSDNFYDLALNDDRWFGLGSVVRIPDNSLGPERWLIELEYSDVPTADDLETFFDQLGASLPTAIADQLSWVVRSPDQERLAADLERDDHRLAERIVRYRDVIPTGQVAVYNPGIAAGSLRFISSEADLAAAVDTDILVMETVPDYLPPANAIITSNPQTPLAHVNLLARNRQIPNASVAGITDDPAIVQAARGRAPAIVQAGEDGSLDIVLITREEYRQWLDLAEQDPIAVPARAEIDAPLVIDLSEVASTVKTEEQLADWRPVIGGKAAGFVTILNSTSDSVAISHPDTPLAINAEVYHRHLQGLGSTLDAIDANPDFASSSAIRFLVLEGPEAFEERYTRDFDLEAAEAFRTANPPGSPLGEVLEAGGFVDLIRDQPISPADYRTIVDMLEQAYGSYDKTQGLRFRSSSTVEDIEGFSGAGLYDSNTGFFAPTIQPDEGDHNKTIEWALKKTWASYWGFEAYEERRREGVDHRRGAMAVLVHARFDDPLELGNGVATVTLDGPTATIEINTQRGAISVTNPDPLDPQVPEVVRLRVDGASNSVERIAESSIEGDGPVLSDAAIDELRPQLLAVAESWRDQLNASLAEPQHVEVVALDFEFKMMDGEWPAGGPSSGRDRIVIKQARSLDPGLRAIPTDVAALPIPRDVLARASLITTPDCVTVEVYTDALATPDMGYSTEPLVVTWPVDSAATSCRPGVLYATPDQFLIGLVEAPGRTVLSD